MIIKCCEGTFLIFCKDNEPGIQNCFVRPFYLEDLGMSDHTFRLYGNTDYCIDKFQVIRVLMLAFKQIAALSD